MNGKQEFSKTTRGTDELSLDELTVYGTATFLGGVIGINATNPTPVIVNSTDVGGTGVVQIRNTNTGNNFAILQLVNNVGAASLFINSSTRTQDGGPNVFTIRNDTNAGIRIITQGDNGIFIAGTTGNVGMGTLTTPEKLNVNGNASVSGAITGGSFSTGGSFIQSNATSRSYFGKYVQRGFYAGGSVRPVIIFPVPFTATDPVTQISVVCTPIRGNTNIITDENRMLYSVAVNNVTNIGFWASKSFYNTITGVGGADVDTGFYWIATAAGLDT